MADKTIHVIRVDRGRVDLGQLEVRRGEKVLWVPKTTGVKIKIRFKNSKSPFDAIVFPPGEPGEPVSAVVRDDADADSYAYDHPGGQPVEGKETILADPVIIVRDIVIP